MSVASLFENPTIKTLSASLFDQINSGLDSLAIPIRTKGTQRPLFIVHETTGIMGYGVDLAPYVDINVPIYGLEGQPLGDAYLNRTTQAIATRLKRIIRAVQPQGPYRLAGWSCGGIFAYEIASQLIGEDESVEFLGLFDTFVKQVFIKNFEVVNEANNNLTQRIDSDIALLFRVLRINIDALNLDVLTMDFEQVVNMCKGMDLLPQHITAKECMSYIKRYEIHEMSNDQYDARKLPIHVHLFSAQEDVDEKVPPLLGWDSILPLEQIQIIPVAGTHLTMMELPNIEPLGVALSTAINLARKDTVNEDANDYSPLVTIQSGSARIKPVFCVPGAGASVASLTDLASVLGNSRPVLGLQPRGLDGESVPHSTVTAAAKCYIKAIQDEYPEGELHLFGHSFGGWVVFEMANLLEAIGRSVASITLVDTELPDENENEVKDYTDSEVFMKLVEIYEQSAKSSLGLSDKDFESLVHRDRLALLHERLVRIGLMSKRSKPEMLDSTVHCFGVALRTSYHPQKVYFKPVRLVLARDETLDEESDLRRRDETVEKWKRWAPNLEYWYTQANHMSILKSPDVDELVAWMKLD
jgi:thioesterase domain-containing protein